MPKANRYARIAITLPAPDLAAADRLARAPDCDSHEGLGPSRLAQLTRDLQLTPEQRVLAAEETLRQTGVPRRPRRHYVLTFDRYEEFLDWKESRDAG